MIECGYRFMPVSRAAGIVSFLSVGALVFLFLSVGPLVLFHSCQ